MLPLAKILATASCRSSKTGPPGLGNAARCTRIPVARDWVHSDAITCQIIILFDLFMCFHYSVVTLQSKELRRWRRKYGNAQTDQIMSRAIVTYSLLKHVSAWCIAVSPIIAFRGWRSRSERRGAGLPKIVSRVAWKCQCPVAGSLFFFWLGSHYRWSSRSGLRTFTEDATMHVHGLWVWYMITSSNGNIFRVTGHLCEEFTGRRWIPRTKASDAELSCFLWSALNKRLSKQWQGWWFETPSRPLWRHCNDVCLQHW